MAAEVEHSPRFESSPLNFSSAEDVSPNLILLRVLMQGKEVGSIIGKKGDNVRRYREESGAKINISDGSCPERIVTVTGTVDQIYKAFELICLKFDEDLQAQAALSGSAAPLLTVRLIVPASQCGSLIGKGGSKIKEVRESTGASVQVAGEMLPNSTERAVAVSGPAASVSHCIHSICNILLESPPKGATIPYRPRSAVQNPFIYAATGVPSQTSYTYSSPLPIHTLQGALQLSPGLLQQSLTMPTSHITKSSSTSSDGSGIEPMVSQASPAVSTAHATPPQYPQQHLTPPHLAQLPSHNAPLMFPQAYGAYLNTAYGLMGGLHALGAYMGSRPQSSGLSSLLATLPSQTQSTELVIPNELIGCIIGRGGTKINEIRQLSGAQIKIANCEEGKSERKVTISGFPETITTAVYLINISIEHHKNQLLGAEANSLNSSDPVKPSLNAAATLLAKPSDLIPCIASNSGFGLTNIGHIGAYDPKILVAASNKLKMLSTPAGMKIDQRFTPY